MRKVSFAMASLFGFWSHRTSKGQKEFLGRKQSQEYHFCFRSICVIFCKNVTTHFQKRTAKIAVFQGNCLLLIEVQVEQKWWLISPQGTSLQALWYLGLLLPLVETSRLSLRIEHPSWCCRRCSLHPLH